MTCFVLDFKQNDIDAIRTGNWELACLKMDLVRGDGSESFSGSGYIRLTDDRQLTFTLLDTTCTPDIKKIFNDYNQPTLKVGQLIPKQHQYTLKATDDHNRTWISPPTIFNIHKSHEQNKGTVIRGKLDEIRSENSLENVLPQDALSSQHTVYKNYKLIYHLFTDIGSFPCNAEQKTIVTVQNQERYQTFSLCVSQHDSCDFHYELLEKENDTIFTIESNADNNQPPEFMPMRFAEALQFVVGRPIDWEIFIVGYGNNEAVRVRPLPKRPNVIKMLPPIQWRKHQYFDEFWRMYDCYLFCIRNYYDSHWHQLSRRIFTLQHAMTSLWPIAMLSASVEIEGLVQHEMQVDFSECPNIKHLVDVILTFIRTCSYPDGEAIDEQTVSRFTGALKNISSPTVRNKLDKLKDMGFARQADIETWSFVRNKATHAVKSEINISQENIKHRFQLVTLFYHLIFHLIGYHGKYTDYGEREFPTKNYPFEAHT
jgi:hypothetical protein